MPIRPEYRWLYPIDWPHGRFVCHLGDGRWWDPERGTWKDGQGRALRRVDAENLLAMTSTTRIVLATAHRDHDPTNNRVRNLVAFCQRCHMLHDREEHRRRRWLTLFRRKALGNLFLGHYR